MIGFITKAAAILGLVGIIGLGAVPATVGLAQTKGKDTKDAKAEKAKAKTHRVAIQVNENRPEVMTLALNNAKNVLEHFKALGEPVSVEIVTYGPGLHMLRDDTSTVKQRIAQMTLEEPSISFSACGNTQSNMSKAEQKPISLIAEAKVVPSGVIRLMELQGKGYSYIRP